MTTGTGRRRFDQRQGVIAGAVHRIEGAELEVDVADPVGDQLRHHQRQVPCLVRSSRPASRTLTGGLSVYTHISSATSFRQAADA